ncbi:MAG: glycosyltransferase family 1 protein [Rhodospirillales bacterium]|nr:glycosyltransferase family 1 protein [Rhodospirillales bacterium]
MKIVVQNPHLLGETSTSGINDWGVDFLRLYRPAIRIWPLKSFPSWLKFLIRKKLPLTGWTYVMNEADLNSYDVWMGWQGAKQLPFELIPRHFPGIKLYHVMDYSFRTREAAEICKEFQFDYLMGYSRHDQWCGFFRSHFQDYENRVVPVPFGFGPRFVNQAPFYERKPKCAAMGAVNLVNDTNFSTEILDAYVDYFRDDEWAHPMRQSIRENIDQLDNIITNFLATWPERVNLAYDSVQELNRYQLFVNDDSVMHYPPARTYEGVACGSVMVCSDNPCFNDYGWIDGVNCLRHRFADLDSFQRVVADALADQDRLAEIRKTSLAHAKRFAHIEVARGLYDTLGNLIAGKTAGLGDHWKTTRT